MENVFVDQLIFRRPNIEKSENNFRNVEANRQAMMT